MIDFGPQHRCVQATDTRPMFEASNELGVLACALDHRVRLHSVGKCWTLR